MLSRSVASPHEDAPHALCLIRNDYLYDNALVARGLEAAYNRFEKFEDSIRNVKVATCFGTL